MKKYFAIAALLGVFAFGSVSLLAHAQQPDDTTYDMNSHVDSDAGGVSDIDEDAENTGSVSAKARAYGAQAAPAPSDERMEAFDAARQECEDAAHANDDADADPDGEDAAMVPTDKEIQSAYLKCMRAKNYTDRDLNELETAATRRDNDME